jgi:predicted metal-dependent phosphoesterase TrpH
MIAIDLHTHSTASPDGGLRAEDYDRMFAHNSLHVVAVTDHNSIQMALVLHKKFGERIIIGEEVMAQEGEIIGLYLHKAIPAGLSAVATAQAIKQQGGLVYIPHPFETVRKGLPLAVLNTIIDAVDIIETRNGRAIFQKYDKQAVAWSQAYYKPGAASSDAHGRHGWGKTYSQISAMPSRETLVKLLQTAQYSHAFPGVRAILYPKYNRLKVKKNHA